MIEPPEIRRILQESAAAPDAAEWFRTHPAESRRLRAFLERVEREQEHFRRREREASSEGTLPVGPLLPPPGTYTFSPATPPIHAPDGELLAQLAHIPESLGDFVGVAFPPFGPPAKVHPKLLQPLEERIAYRMVGLVQYRGEEGEVTIETIQPSPATLRRELVLGNPAGLLSDGTPLFAMWDNHLRLARGDVIIDLYAESRGMTHDRLHALAEDVILV